MTKHPLKPDKSKDPSVTVGGASRLELALTILAGLIILLFWILSIFKIMG